MIKDFLTKKLMERQLKNLPPQQQEAVMNAVNKNPELFNKIAKEVKEQTKKGVPEIAATMSVMRKYQGELQKALR